MYVYICIADFTLLCTLNPKSEYETWLNPRLGSGFVFRFRIQIAKQSEIGNRERERERERERDT
jgi:hypothetical protein